jgi:hypothetical protein
MDMHHLLVAGLLIRISPACRPQAGDRRKPLRHVTSAAEPFRFRTIKNPAPMEMKDRLSVYG